MKTRFPKRIKYGGRGNNPAAWRSSSGYKYIADLDINHCHGMVNAESIEGFSSSGQIGVPNTCVETIYSANWGGGNQFRKRVVHPGLALAVFSALLCLSSAASSADWIYLGQDGRGNHWHVDKASVQREGNLVMSWKRIEFGEPYPHFATGSSIRTALLLDATNCARHQAHVTAIRLVDMDGVVVAAHEHGDQDHYLPLVRHVTLLDKAMTLVCPAP